MVRIYTLEDPTVKGKDGIRYVGKTVGNLSERFRGGYNAHCKNWLASLKSQGIAPIQAEIDYIEDEDWEAGERLYIQEYRAIGCPLTNITDGGEGVVGRIVSKETRRKIGDKHKGKTISEKHKRILAASVLSRDPYWAGKERSAETRKKISETKKGTSPPNKGIPCSDEQKAKQSARMKGRPSPNKGKVASEETRRKQSEAKRGKEPWNKGLEGSEWSLSRWISYANRRASRLGCL